MKHTTTRSGTGIYQRTSKGRAAILRDDSGLMDGLRRRLLLMVNGFTPLEHLLQLADIEEDVSDSLLSLEAEGLIQQADEGPVRGLARMGLCTP